MTVSALIVEDEPLSRRNLRDYMALVPWLNCVGEAVSGRDALAMIDRLQPDLVFLDIHLPEMSGLQVAAQMRWRPFIVFTTAYDQYAVTAFELEAVDYLLKPFSGARFVKTMERIRGRILQGEARRELHARLPNLSGAEAYPRRIFVRRGRHILPLATEEVIYFKAAENYVEVHGGGGVFLVHITMGDLETRLDPAQFIRIHRSYTVNMRWIQGMEAHDERRLAVRLPGNQTIVASRSGSQKLRRYIF